jgi:regulator of replication initiation timing
MFDAMDGGGEHTVSHGDVEVTRTLDADETKIVGELEIRSTAIHTVSVEVVDEFPPNASVESVRFKSGATPDDHDVSAERLVVEQTVDDDPERIVYGVALADSVEDVVASKPDIREVTPVATAGGVTESLDGGRAIGDGGSDTATEAATLSLEEPADDADEGSDAANSGDGPALDGMTADREPASEADDAELEFASESEEVPSGPSLDGLNDVSESDADRSVDTGGPTPAGQTTDTDESTPADETTDTGDSPPTDDTQSIDETPTDKESTDEDRGSSRRSVEMRFDHLSARVEKFGAYTSALEDFIDEHGTVSEFFDRVDEDVTDLETRIDGTHDELSAEIDDVREDVDHLATEIERVRDDVDAMREEISVLTTEVRELRSMRESLAAVLTEQDTTGGGTLAVSDDTDIEVEEQSDDLVDEEDDIATAVSGVESNTDE